MDDPVSDAVRSVKLAFPFPSYLGPDFEEEASVTCGAVRQLSPPPGRLLDIGSGPMNLTAVFSNLGYDCSAIDDLDDPWHAVGDNRRRICEFARSAGIDYIAGSAEKASEELPDESFDVVVMTGVIEHLHQSPRDLLNAAFRLTKTGGIVAVTMPNSVNLRKRMSVIQGKTNYPEVSGFLYSTGTWRGHVREYTLKETRFIMEASGGEIIRSGTFHANAKRRLPNMFARYCYFMLTKFAPTLRDGVLVVAMKPVGWTPQEYDEARYRSAIARFGGGYVG
jgi:2-polyprenyl-3-methyl-5-hydroxy-6-metoxy-1,4-benzoquinol methylase